MISSFGQTVTLLTRTITGQDAHGTDIYTGAGTDYHNVPVWPAGSSELSQGQDILSDTLVALLPHGTAVTPTDRATILGRTYEVTGYPFDWVSPLTGTRPGVQINLRAVTG